MLKKILIFLLTLITLISAVACGENESGVGGGGQGEIDKNYQKWDVWGTKTIEFINDDVLDFTCHRDALVDFYNWMQPHVEYANSQWGR